MKKYKLKNGITLIHHKSPSPSVTIEAWFNVGSNDETVGIRGISHFLEHMLFEGTTKRKDSRTIASEIEDLGGQMNAYTTSDRTAYYIKVLNKHFDKALDVISDMIINSVFADDKITKESKVITKEIDMVHDQPRFYQWIQFQKALFSKHPVKNPTYGTVNDVKNMTRDKLLQYYKKYYTPNNMYISIVGGVDNIKPKVEKAFKYMPKSKKPILKSFTEPNKSKPSSSSEKRKINSCYVVMGYKTCPRSHKDSYALDIVEAILGKGQSGRMFDVIRNKHGLAYEVSVHNESSKDYGMFAVSASIDPHKVAKGKKIMLEEFMKASKFTKKEFEDAKTFIEGKYTIDNEDNHEYADQLCFWEMIDKAEFSDSYVKKIKKVKFNDVVRVAKKYLNKNYTVTVLGPSGKKD